MVPPATTDAFVRAHQRALLDAACRRGLARGAEVAVRRSPVRTLLGRVLIGVGRRLADPPPPPATGPVRLCG